MKNTLYRLSVLALCLYLTPAQAGAVEPAVRSLDHIVAVVNDEAILRSELDQYLQGVIRFHANFYSKTTTSED